MDIYIVYNNDSILKRIGDAKLKASPFFHFIDDRTYKGKKDSWKVKGALSAKLTPFIAVYENNVPIKAFYSETGEDVIESLINFINNYA